MNEKRKAKMVRNIVKAVLYGVAVLSVFLILGGILSDSYITVTLNWVQCLIGFILLIVADKLYDWLFPAKRFVRKDEDNERR